MAKNAVRNNRKIGPAWINAAQDIFFSVLSSLLAILALRLISEPIYLFIKIVLIWVGVSALASLVGIEITKCHKTVRRYANYKTFLRILGAVAIKEAVLAAILLFHLIKLPETWECVLVITFDAILTAAFLAYLRILPRLSMEKSHIKQDAGKKTALVVWVGDESIELAAEAEQSGRYQVLGYLSSEQSLSGRRIGERVIFWCSDLQQLHTLQWKLGGIDTILFPKGGDPLKPVQSDIKEDEIAYNDSMTLEGNMVKRGFDILVSGLLLVLLSPLMGICALAIKLEDGGSCIFSQERIGRGGKPFNIYKFRSMKLDAEKAGPALYSGEKDPRLTRVGAFLRAHHLDELPQLWNVLKGDMSFIGHRPERQYYIDRIMAINPRYHYLYQIRPGVTSYATLYNGYTDTLEKMLTRLDLDLYYLRNRSVLFDIKIMVLTALNVAAGKKI